MEPHTKRLVVTNTGNRPVHISFIPKLDDTVVCKPWLDVKPLSTVMHPRESVWGGGVGVCVGVVFLNTNSKICIPVTVLFLERLVFTIYLIVYGAALF